MFLNIGFILETFQRNRKIGFQYTIFAMKQRNILPILPMCRTWKYIRSFVTAIYHENVSSIGQHIAISREWKN